jgi:hypothetical protein
MLQISLHSQARDPDPDEISFENPSIKSAYLIQHPQPCKIDLNYRKKPNCLIGTVYGDMAPQRNPVAFIPIVLF